MLRSNLSALAAGLMLAWGCSAAVAQTTPKPAPTKPAATKPAAAAPSDGSARTLDGSTGAANGKLMLYKELKVCMQRQDDLQKRRLDVEAQGKQLDGERAKIQEEAAAVKAENDRLVKRGEAVNEFQARMTAYSAKVKDWNDRAAAFAANDRSGPSADRTRKQLDVEEKALKQEEIANKAEADALTNELKSGAEALKVRADAQAAAATSWNERNTKQAELTRAYENDRLDWRTDCGSRRYREDDEKLIRQEMGR